jgi:hypothetical protein
MRKLILNYGRSSGTRPRKKCDRTVLRYNLTLVVFNNSVQGFVMIFRISGQFCASKNHLPTVTSDLFALKEHWPIITCWTVPLPVVCSICEHCYSSIAYPYTFSHLDLKCRSGNSALLHFSLWIVGSTLHAPRIRGHSVAVALYVIWRWRGSYCHLGNQLKEYDGWICYIISSLCAEHYNLWLKYNVSYEIFN